ncbi:transporter substrate-binding domain-containing protein [Amylolactobacillus amylophilus]|uniref:transporter substrate-binding domain-containing protein n=1 Tax=Amylolactobacillus amylophilus TaxID=1603 RepID=UPI0006D27C7F|nr:transporter substrate-binding domain-containing protein [Amylolactobacillus amylophilus]
MKNKIIGILTLFGTLLLLTGCGLTRDLKQVNAGQETIIVGLDETFVPMGFRAKNGELTGFDIDLAQAVSKQIKQKKLLFSRSIGT